MGSIIKTALTLVSVFLLFSCQNDLDDALDKGLSNELQTKSSVSVPSVLSQLSGIPVNIRLKSGNKNYSYLSTSKKNNTVDLHDIDDGSLRQRWFISLQPTIGSMVTIRVEGGAYTNGYLVANGSPGNYTPKLWNNVSPIIGMDEGNVESTFYIYTGIPNSLSGAEYLYSVDATNRGLAFAEKNKTGGRYVWEIIPVESFTLRDVTYFMDSGDKIDSSFVFLHDYYLDNRVNSSPVNHKAVINETFKSFSGFSEVTGMRMSDKITNSASFKVGIPSINASGSISFEHLTEKSWSYTTTDTEEKTLSWSDEFSTVVPANKLMILKVYMQKYQFDISYLGTLVGNTTGRTIKLKGRWNGSFGSKIVYRPVIDGVSVNSVEKNVNQLKVMGE